MASHGVIGGRVDGCRSGVGFRSEGVSEGHWKSGLNSESLLDERLEMNLEPRAVACC